MTSVVLASLDFQLLDAQVHDRIIYEQNMVKMWMYVHIMKVNICNEAYILVTVLMYAIISFIFASKLYCLMTMMSFIVQKLSVYAVLLLHDMSP